MLPVLLLVTALIVYGSLYPWQFHAAAFPGNPFLVLLQSWSFQVNRFLLRDIAVNIVLYLPFGAACYLWLARRPLMVRLALPLVLALILSSSMEMIQLFDGRRTCSMLDVLTNFAGAFLGVAVATQFRARITIRPSTAAPLFLLSCLVCAVLFPFMPDFSTYHLISKVRTFDAQPFSAVAFFSSLVMWLAAARLAECAYKRALVPIFLLLLPIRFFISGITLTWLDLTAAILATVVYLVIPFRTSVLALLAILSIALSGLVPFHFADTRQSFSWIPFRALFTTDWEKGFAIFFRKCFSYGSAIWLLTASGLSLTVSATGVAALLAVLEVAQLWLPNHVAESTDPLHAILLAWILYQLTRNEKPRRGV